MHLWCYILHGILFALHIILLLLLIYHPEHNIIMPLYNSWLTTTLSVGLQAFYVVSSLSSIFIYNKSDLFQALYCSIGVYCATAWTIQTDCTKALFDNSPWYCQCMDWSWNCSLFTFTATKSIIIYLVDSWCGILSGMCLCDGYCLHHHHGAHNLQQHLYYLGPNTDALAK